MAVTVDIDDIITEWGAYYVNQGQNLSRIKEKLYQPSETEKYFKLQLVDNTIDDNGYAEMDEVLQPYQDTFTPKGDLTFLPVRIPLYQQKIDWEKNPNAFVSSWLGFLADNKLDRAEWPIIRYIIEKHLLDRRNHDKEVSTIFKGVYAAPTPGTAGAASTAMHGVRKVIRLWNTDGRSENIPTGALETDPEEFVTQLEDFVETIPAHVRNRITNLFIDIDLMKRYRAGKRIKYNQNYLQSNDLESIEDHQNIKVTGLTSMQGSEMIFTSLPELMVRKQKWSQNANLFKVESAKRMVSILTDWWEGVGFLVPEYLYHNDRDLS